MATRVKGTPEQERARGLRNTRMQERLATARLLAELATRAGGPRC